MSQEWKKVLSRFWMIYRIFWLTLTGANLISAFVTFKSKMVPTFLINILIDQFLLTTLCAGLIQLSISKGLFSGPIAQKYLQGILAFLFVLAGWSVGFVLLDSALWLVFGRTFSTLGSYTANHLDWSFKRLPDFLLLASMWNLPTLFASFVGSMGVISLLLTQHRSQEREVRASRMETSLIRARLQVMQAQLQPHFLFNVLITIQSMIHEDPERADIMIGRLGRFLRVTLDDRDVQVVSLRKELDVLERYLGIEKIRFEDRMQLEWDVPDSCLDLGVPFLILQPLAENSVKHGVSMLSGEIKIGIRARLIQDKLVLDVWDTGPGPVFGAKEGIGLSNTRARLLQLFGEEAKLELLESPEGGALARVSLPAESTSRIESRLKPMESVKHA